MIRIIKLLYAVSVLVFLVVLLYIYAFLPDQVGIYFNALGEPIWQITKAAFFYATLGVFVLTNGLILLYKNLSKSDDAMRKWQTFSDWLSGLSLIINVTCIFSVLFIGMYHNAEHFDITNYIVLVYLGPALLVGWIFWFIYLQFLKK